jgi:hypothetical protein
MHLVPVTLNAAASQIRRELHDGRMHTIVPAVIVVAGVLNGALLTADELAKVPEAWNGRPIPLHHPQQDGQFISANHPDVLERAMGKVFNTRFDVDRLRAEFWLDEQRFEAMNLLPLLQDIQNGKTIEVSTGYFSENLPEAGELSGKKYDKRQTNLRPDHVALLPDQVGACSIADGCGAPRVNADMDPAKKGLTHALHVIGAALGLNVNCSCEDTMKPTDIAALATNLKTKGVDLSDLKVNFDLAELTKMDDAGRAAIYGALKALEKASAKAAAEPPADDAAKVAANATAQPITMGQLQTMIANGIAVGIAAELPKAVASLKTELQTNARKAEVIARLMANEGNAFTQPELEAMSIDYSGAAAGAGYAANADDKPLGLGLGLLSIKPAN